MSIILFPGLMTPPMVLKYSRCTMPFTGERKVVRLTRSCNAVCVSFMRPISALTSFNSFLALFWKLSSSFFLLKRASSMVDLMRGTDNFAASISPSNSASRCSNCKNSTSLMMPRSFNGCLILISFLIRSRDFFNWRCFDLASSRALFC